MKAYKFRFSPVMMALSLSMIMFLSIVNPCFAAESADKFPSKPITVLMPYGAGGITDAAARKLAELASERLGQPVVLEPKTGGAGVICTASIAKAKPDGYTIGVVTGGATTVVPHIRTVPYDIKTDFTFIMSFLKYKYGFLSVRADSKWKTFQEFVTDARNNPGKLNYGSPGALSGDHITFQYIFSVLEKVKVNHVPMKGNAEIIPKLLGGHIDAGTGGGFLPHIQSGKLRPLVAYEKYDDLPNVPTPMELGYDKTNRAWAGVLGPKNIDPMILQKLFSAFKSAWEDPAYQEHLRKIRVAPFIQDPDAFKSFILQEYESKVEMLKQTGLIK